jgi:hypothetical protein
MGGAGRRPNKSGTRDGQDEVVIDPSAAAAALEKLKKHSEPEAGFMRTGAGTAPAYNVQTAVDAEHVLIVPCCTAYAAMASGWMCPS